MDLPGTALRVAAALPEVTLTRPFGPDWDVGKIRGKVFALITAVPGDRLGAGVVSTARTPIVTVKCAPEHGVALRAEFPTVIPGYHMNKRHWITVADGPGVTDELVTDLVTEAYLLVVEALPLARRPPLPDHLARYLRRG